MFAGKTGEMFFFIINLDTCLSVPKLIEVLLAMQGRTARVSGGLSLEGPIRYSSQLQSSL